MLDLVITDPQNDLLSPKGVTWEVVGESVTENNTVENIETLLRTAKAQGIPVFISPHYYYPTDHGCKFEGALETLMHSPKMFNRKGALNLSGFEGSGADWLERYKPYINDPETVIASPHKVYGPETNDLVLQLRKRGIDNQYRMDHQAGQSRDAFGLASASPVSEWAVRSRTAVPTRPDPSGGGT